MGIKNFQGKFEKSGKKLPENIKVHDHMKCDLITFHPEQTIPQVIAVLVANKISGGPVVNDKNELVGIISEGDCIKQISYGQYYNMPIEEIKVANCMVKDVETIDGNVSIFEAANKFLTAKRRRFPIVSENNELLGMISQKDILKAALKMDSQSWDPNK